MYSCSNAFRQAVANNTPQMALFFFQDGVITNEDIDVEEGVDFDDYFCTRTDLGIGEALSNELNFVLMNEKQVLNDFPFGEFEALLGARVSHVPSRNTMTMNYGGHTYQGTYSRGRYLMKDGRAASVQPSFPVASLAAKDGTVYCFSENGDVFAVSASGGQQVSCPSNAFMREKTSRWGGNTFAYDNRMLTIVGSDGYEDKYEFVPLGVFDAERPNVVDDVQLKMECNDRMTRFDADMELELEYPITAGELLNRICSSEDVELETGSFLNSDATLDVKPPEFDSCTKRDVLCWVAAIAGCNAKITRDGKMSLIWVGSQSRSFSERNYTECRPYYYQTKSVSQLCHRDMRAAVDTKVGSGGNIYLIQDNPFLREDNKEPEEGGEKNESKP